MRNEHPIRCHRCHEVMTMFVVGDDYCRPCKREIRERDTADGRRLIRFPFGKDLGPGRPAA